MHLPAQDNAEALDAGDLPCVLFACALDGKGGASLLDTGPIATYGILPSEGYWVHLFLDHPDTRSWLERFSGLDESAIDALMQARTRPRVSEHEDGAIVILRGVNLGENEEPEDMVSVRIHIDKRRVITVRKRNLAALDELRGTLVKGRGPNDMGEFIAMLSEILCNQLEPVLTLLNEEMDTAEEKLLETPQAILREQIADIRKQAIMFHRYLAPQRDVLARLRLSDQRWLHAADKRSLMESYDRVTRYVEDLDALRDRAQIINDELAFALSSRLNKNTFVLSIVSAIFLPLTFVTGLLGMNVAGIPYAEAKDAFGIIVVVLIFAAAMQLFFLRRMRWF